MEGRNLDITGTERSRYGLRTAQCRLRAALCRLRTLCRLRNEQCLMRTPCRLRTALCLFMSCLLVTLLAGCGPQGCDTDKFGDTMRDKGLSVTKLVFGTCSSYLASSGYAGELSFLPTDFQYCSVALDNTYGRAFVHAEFTENPDLETIKNGLRDEIARYDDGSFQATEMPDGYEIVYDGGWAGAYVEKNTILAAIADDSSRDDTLDTVHKLGYGVKRTPPWVLIVVIAALALAVGIAVTVFVRRRRQARHLRELEERAAQQRKTMERLQAESLGRGMAAGGSPFDVPAQRGDYRQGGWSDDPGGGW